MGFDISFFAENFEPALYDSLIKARLLDYRGDLPVGNSRFPIGNHQEIQIQPIACRIAFWCLLALSITSPCQT